MKSWPVIPSSRDGFDPRPHRKIPQNAGFSFMEYVVYIIQSQFDQSFYIGYTHSIEERVREHNEGSTRYTSHKRPWILVYVEAFQSKKEAIQRERFLKKQKNRHFYLQLINSKKSSHKS